MDKHWGEKHCQLCTNTEKNPNVIGGSLSLCSMYSTVCHRNQSFPAPRLCPIPMQCE